MTSDDNGDPWIVGASGQRQPQAAAHFAKAVVAQELGLIPPLTDTIEDAEKPVPDALKPVLFPEGETSAPVHTYAIFDAAKAVNLVELLETSGLEHGCLFNGAAGDNLAAVAPWLVRLEEGHPLTRNLFVSSDEPWHYWKAEVAIFLRSPLDLDQVRQHFRKFTKAPDKDGNWFFIRFYEPRFLVAYLKAMVPEKQAYFMGKTQSILAIADGIGTVFAQSSSS